jgi:hypothetical protein
MDVHAAALVTVVAGRDFDQAPKKKAPSWGRWIRRCGVTVFS